MSEGSITAVARIRRCMVGMSIAAIPLRRRRIVPQRIVTLPRLWTLGLFQLDCAIRLALDVRLALDDRGLRLLGSAFDLGGSRRLPMMCKQPRRPLVADGGAGWRRVDSQARIGRVPRRQERVEPKRRQAKHGQVHRKRDADRRTLCVDAMTGHGLRITLAPPRTTPVATKIAAGEFATIREYPELRLRKTPR